MALASFSEFFTLTAKWSWKFFPRSLLVLFSSTNEIMLTGSNDRESALDV